MPTPSARQQWERAEIARSSVEAELTDAAALKVRARTFNRYASPPADTAYPLEYAYSLLGDIKGLHVLDLGCGSGANTVHLANRGARVWAVDISEHLLRIAARRLEVNDRSGGTQFVVGSAHDLPFASASFDVVFGIAILHHLDLRLVAREILRVLRPGGRAVFSEPVRNSRLIKVVRALIPYRQPDISPFERPLTDHELREFGAQFASFRTRPFGLPHVQVAQVLPGLRKKLDAFYRIDRALLRTLPVSYYAGIRVLEVTR